MSPMEATVDPSSRGSRLDADHPENGVLIPCVFTDVPARERFAAALDAASRYVALRPDPQNVGLLLDAAHAAKLAIKREDVAHGLGLGRVDDKGSLARLIAERHIATHPHPLLLRGGNLVADAFAGNLPLKLSKGQQHIEGQPPHRARGVELLG